jgi:hypothetical protein
LLKIVAVVCSVAVQTYFLLYCLTYDRRPIILNIIHYFNTFVGAIIAIATSTTTTRCPSSMMWHHLLSSCVVICDWRIDYDEMENRTEIYIIHTTLAHSIFPCCILLSVFWCQMSERESDRPFSGLSSAAPLEKAAFLLWSPVFLFFLVE